MVEMMYAVSINEFGGPDVLRYQEVPRPQPTDNQLLVKIHAAGINPVDWKTRMGRGMAHQPGFTLPYILGWDISGEVVEVGANVDSFSVGDQVFGMIGFPGEGAAYAQYAAVNPDHIARKPRTLSHIEAGAIPLVALTTWQALFDTADLQPGQRILIHAAAGGIGHIAVQLARWRGAEIWGTASAKNATFLKELGVDHIVDYTAAPFEDQVEDMQVVFDTVGGEITLRSFKTLQVGGFLVSIQGHPDVDLARDTPAGLSSKRILVQTNADQLKVISSLIDEGHLKPHISTVLPLANAGEAHRLSETGHTRGKIVLEVSHS